MEEWLLVSRKALPVPLHRKHDLFLTKFHLPATSIYLDRFRCALKEKLLCKCLVSSTPRRHVTPSSRNPVVT